MESYDCRLQEMEGAAGAEASALVAGVPSLDYCTVLIPLLLVEFERFWVSVLAKIGVRPQDS